MFFNSLSTLHENKLLLINTDNKIVQYFFRETNATVADHILGSVQRTLASSPFMFKDDFACIISGEEEGLSSWVTVNYLNGAFKESQVCHRV